MPSTEDVRNHFAYGCGPEHTWDGSREAFDRWLAEVRATALEEAADRLDGDSAAALWEMWDTARNQYTTPTDALRARAARNPRGRTSMTINEARYVIAHREMYDDATFHYALEIVDRAEGRA